MFGWEGSTPSYGVLVGDRPLVPIVGNALVAGLVCELPTGARDGEEGLEGFFVEVA